MWGYGVRQVFHLVIMIVDMSSYYSLNVPDQIKYTRVLKNVQTLIIACVNVMKKTENLR